MIMLAGHDAEYVRLVWWIAAAFGIAVLVGLAVVYRRAIRRDELEQAERVIAEHDRDP